MQIPKGKGKGKDNKGDFKGHGKGLNGKGKGQYYGGYANYVGNEYAPNPIPLQAQHHSTYPQLMATPWNNQMIGTLCSFETKNMYAEICEDDDDDEFPKIENLKSWPPVVCRLPAAASQQQRVSGENQPDSEAANFKEIPWKVFKKKVQKKLKPQMKGHTDCEFDLECLLADNENQQMHLNPMSKGDWEKVSFMVDSGASETVANEEMFEGFPLSETSSTGTEYSSACNGGPSIKNAGEKVIEVMNGNGEMNFMKVQMCSNLNPRKFLASVSRISQAGHRVVFDVPEEGSYIENKITGVKTWLRQEGGVYYLDLWVSPASTFGRPGANM
jgi:hypothetical protein